MLPPYKSLTVEINYRIKEERLLSKEWGRLQTITYETSSPQRPEWKEQKAELYDPGDGATVLLYDKRRRCVLLNRQFRIATVYRDHPSGITIETCAGKLDD